MILIHRRHAGTTPATERLVLNFDARSRSRQRCRFESGEEAGLTLPRGIVLRDGDLLEADDGRVVQVVAASEPLMEVLCAYPGQLARAAYHLGNRHVALELGEGWLRFPRDHVLRDMLTGLGFRVNERAAPFQPEAGAYGFDHSHLVLRSRSEVHGGGPCIHEYAT